MKPPMALLRNAVCFSHKMGSTSSLSTSATLSKESYKVVVCGHGTGGAAMTSKFAGLLGKGQVAVIEPHDDHYYQGAWTLVGGGMKKLEESKRLNSSIMHPDATWIKERVAQFKPSENTVVTKQGKEIGYENLVIALGLQIRFDMVKGLPEAFDYPGVCSNYTKDTVEKTYKALSELKSGNAIFTFPQTPIKCAGAPQKIMYIAEDHFRRAGVRDKINIQYFGGAPILFSAKHYADILWDLSRKRNVSVNLQRALVEVKPKTKEAVFAILDKTLKPTGENVTVNYDMIHIGPPCSAPEVLRNSPEITDGAGYVTVNKETLQHTKFPNIFALGDCTDVPTSKTAAACEFGFEGKVMETTPLDQGKERKSMFLLKKHVLPWIYWNYFVKGKWTGPSKVRKWLHLGFAA